MSSFQGEFVWHELKTTDTNAAKLFYQAVIGWTSEEMEAVPGIPYTRLMMGGAPVAGLMALPPEARAAGAKPHWTGHVAADDIDAMIVALGKAGGSVRFGPMDIPDIGRFANVADPQGAAFSLFEPLPSPNSGPPAPGTPGRVGWYELHADAWQTAFDFYATLFGWTKDRAIDMGPVGTYQLIAHGGPAFGGMMTKMQPGGPPAAGLAVLLQRQQPGRCRGGAEGRWRPGSQRPDGGAGRKLGRPMHGPARRPVCPGETSPMRPIGTRF